MKGIDADYLLKLIMGDFTEKTLIFDDLIYNLLIFI